ncbi:MAG: beta strand repeat-containing protein [Blastocatellia bacterium]
MAALICLSRIGAILTPDFYAKEETMHTANRLSRLSSSLSKLSGSKLRQWARIVLFGILAISAMFGASFIEARRGDNGVFKGIFADCTATLNPASGDVPPEGGNVSVSVSIDSSCAWTASSSVAWATISSGSSGTGNGTVAINVAANTGPQRSGQLSIAGKVFYVTQKGPCTATLDPVSKTAPATGGAESVQLMIGSGCVWTATSLVPWVTINTASGSGPGAVNYTVAANTGSTQRFGTLTIAGQNFTVIQDATCTATIDPTYKSLPATAGSESVGVTVAAGCAWTATTMESWITITSGASGTGNGTVNYSVTANPGGARAGLINIAGKTLAVAQEGACAPTFDPATSQNVVASGATHSVSVTMGAMCNWMVSTSTSWITITSPTNNAGNGTVNYTVAANTGTPRNGSITIAGKNFNVTQDSPCNFSLSPTNQQFVVAGGTGTVNVSVASGCNWTATTNVPWIAFTSSVSGSGNGTVNYSVATNASGSQRGGSINIGGQSLTILQDAGCSYTVSPTSQNVAAAGGMSTASVTTTSSCEWMASSNVNWITITSSLAPDRGEKLSAGGNPSIKNGVAGTGNGSVAYTVGANAGPARSGTFFAAGQLVTVNQASGCSNTVSPANLSAGQVGANYSQQLSSSGVGSTTWSVSVGSLPPGLTLNPGSGLLSGVPTISGTFSFTVRATDSSSNGCYGEMPYTLVINCQPLNITPTTATLPNAIAGATYNQTLALTGGSGPTNWTISAGSLPAGMSLNPTTGVLSGTITVTGTFNFTVKATVSSSGCFTTRPYSITIGCQTITVNEALLATATFNSSYSQTVTQTGGVGGIAWTVSSGSLPAGLTLSTGGQITGAPMATGSFPVTLRATDANNCFGEKAFTLTVNCASFNMTPETLNQGTVSASYSQQLAQTGATNSVTWSLRSGPLPTNLTLSSGGLISGVPNVAGSFPITVRATEAVTGCFTDKAYTLVINCQTINVSPTSLPGGTVGIGYSQTVSQSGGVGTITWSMSAGSLPNGLGLGLTTGILSGLPTVSGTFNFTVRATDGNGCFGERAYQVVIACSGLSISPATLDSAPIVTPYSQQLTLVGGGGTADWTITAGALPSGITLHPTSGLLSGFPNVSGSFNFTVKAALGAIGCFAEQSYTLVITCPTITVNPTTINAGNLGVPYSQQFTQTGAAFNLSWSLSAGSLPNGLTLSTSGLLSGTPVMSGNYPITVRATDGNLCFGERAYTLQIGVCPSISITPNSLPNGLVNTNYSQTLTATGGTPGYSFAVTSGALPAGVTLSTGGALTGSPTVVGSFSFTVTATDQAGCAGTKAYTLQICGVISVNPVSLSNGNNGLSYNQTLTATGGVAPYSFSFSGTLPTELTLTSAGVLSGTPTTAGTFNFTVTAMDANSCIGSRSYTVDIGAGLMFYPLPRPIRLLDTRAGATGCDLPGQPIPGGTSRTQTVAGRTCDGISIPVSAKALTGNITTVGSGGGYLTLYPSDAAQPTVANSNYQPNEILNNVFTVGLGAGDGAFKIFVTSNTHLVVDVTGYYALPGAGGLYFHPLPSPIRLLETRAGQSGCDTPGAPIVGGVARSQQARVSCNGVTIPANAAAVVGNATVVGPGAGGYLTLYPANAARPLVASSNFGTGQLMNAPFNVGLSPDGVFNIYSTTITDLVVDVLGYYSPDAVDVNGAGLLFNPLPRPVRLLETRAGFGGCYTPNAPLAAGSTRTQQARGVCDGVTVAATAQAIVGNATVVAPTGSGYLTFWPSDVARPLVATSNFQTGQVFNRHFTVGLGADGAFKIFTSTTTDLVIDVSGFFAP